MKNFNLFQTVNLNTNSSGASAGLSFGQAFAGPNLGGTMNPTIPQGKIYCYYETRFMPFHDEGCKTISDNGSSMQSDGLYNCDEGCWVWTRNME